MRSILLRPVGRQHLLRCLITILAGIKVHDNVIVNQTWDGILFGQGVVGENWCYNNLLVNTGIGGKAGIWINARDADEFNSGLPFLLHFYNNTLLNSGQSGFSTTAAIQLTYTA